MTRLTNAIFAFVAASIAACGHEPSPEPALGTKPRHTVSIMTFNVENLFDNDNDPNKEDDTFLALADKQTDAHRDRCAPIPVDRWREQCLSWDWSDEIIERKLAVTAAAILQVGEGRGPDIVALQEIENLSILERLRTEYLQAADYLPAVLVEGNDARGIDVAFLTRLPLAAAPALRAVDFSGFPPERIADTRDILEATFELPDGSLLTGYSVHFPAPFQPTGMREAAYEELNRLRAALPPDRPAFAAGDFNTTAAEDRELGLLNRYVRPHWTVSQDLGCGDCRGTSYYAQADDWSFLDMILWSPASDRGESATWSVRADSVRIANRTPDQVTPEGTPWRFEMPGGTGVSDHWPVVVDLETK